MRFLPSFLLLSLSACMAAPALAQSGNAADVSPSTRQTAPGVPAAHELNTSDRVFMRAAAAGGLAEVDFGELAAGSGESQLVKGFAREGGLRKSDRLSRGRSVPAALELGRGASTRARKSREVERRPLRPSLYRKPAAGSPADGAAARV